MCSVPEPGKPLLATRDGADTAYPRLSACIYCLGCHSRLVLYYRSGTPVRCSSGRSVARSVSSFVDRRDNCFNVKVPNHSSQLYRKNIVSTFAVMNTPHRLVPEVAQQYFKAYSAIGVFNPGFGLIAARGFLSNYSSLVQLFGRPDLCPFYFNFQLPKGAFSSPLDPFSFPPSPPPPPPLRLVHGMARRRSRRGG